MSGRLARLQIVLPALALLAFVILAGWRVTAHYQAGRWAEQDPERALLWLPDHPRALRALAEQQLAGEQVQASRATARQLLSVAPLEGQGFRILAEAAAREAQLPQALALYEIAARRSPRDVRARAWLAQHYLIAGDYAQALQHMDAILRTAPSQGAVLVPALSQLARDPAFAAELADTLQSRPPWRGTMLASLQRAEDPAPGEQVMSALRSIDGLTEPEFQDWIASLIRQGRWGEAYSRWASTLDLQSGRLPLLYNGQFELPVSGQGFDWRVLRIPGVSMQFVPDPGASGLVAHASFRGRPVPQVNLEQPLLLGPGRYTFRSRARAQSLRSERGLEWTLTCLGQTQPLAVSAPLQGSFGWRQLDMAVEVPATGCEGQWLRLRNPVPAGSIQRVSGDLWLDEIFILPTP